MDRWAIDRKPQTNWARKTGYAEFAVARDQHRPMTAARVPVIVPAFDAADDYIDDLIRIEDRAAHVREEEMA
jgi:hypothetical protein